MRPWLLVIAGMGCGFDLRPPGALDAPATADAPSVDSAVDASPPPPPACVTMGGYADGGPQAGHRYRVSANAINYDEAVERCASDGAHLVQIDDAAENAHIDQLLGGNRGWIGLHDLEREGTFGWVTRSPGGFRAFDSGEPNDNGTEDCVYMEGWGLWNDTRCEDAHLGVCECDPTYVAPAVAACRAVPGSTTLLGRRYYVRTASLGWPEAAAECAAIGAYLAVPGDDDENQAIDLSFGADSWIGYADRNIDGVLEWVNGATPGYTRWGPAQPSAGVNDLCVAIAFSSPLSSWDDTACSVQRDYACECEPLTR